MAPAAPAADLLADLDGLRALARSLVHGDAEADDLLQDTAVAALEHPPAMDRPVRPWLAAVVRNRWRMDRRGGARRRARDDRAATHDALAPAADELLDRARLLERLARAVVALDEPYRSTVIHRYLDGRTAAEIARTHDIPAGTVRWRLAEGLARLRAALDDDRPRAAWMRALAPVALVRGATIMKAKTTLIGLIALALIASGAAIAIYAGGGDRAAPAPASASASRASAAPTSLPRSIALGARAAEPGPAAADPLPGQGRAIVVGAALPGGAVAGRVINWSTGEGVAGAELTFTGDAGATTLRTNPDGAFVLAPPTPGRFTLAAVAAPGFLPYAPEWAHSTIHLALERDRRVGGVTIFLFPALDYHGVVVDAHGAPVAGAHVALLGTPAGEQRSDRLATEWTTDRDGAFVFHAADDAVLEASAHGARGWARLDGGVAITKRLTITLGDEAARDLTIRGRVVDDRGQPLPDVLVTGQPADAAGPATTTVRATAFATSGADGAFTLTGLDRGAYDLDASDDDGDRAPATARGVAGGTKDVTLTLADGAALTGTVATKDGAPVPAFTLLVHRRDGVARELVIARSIVDQGGRFTVHVAPGDYELTASAAGWAPSPPVAASAPAKVALIVSSGGTLQGTVVSKADGKGIPYARVMREAIGGGASAQPANAGTVTRADGSFELTGLPPGKLSITIGADSFHPRIEAGLAVADDATTGPITIALTPLAPGEEPTLELVGIGVAMSAEPDALVISRVIPGGGAEAAGLVVGDRVIAVDGVSVATLGLEGSIAQIRGNPGTTVTITLRRGTSEVPVVVERRPLHS